MVGRYQEEKAGFVTPRGRAVVIQEPSYPSMEQVNYISTLYEEAEAAIFASDGINPNTGKHFSEYLDVESFAKKYILEELSKNVDASLSSQYFYKPPDTTGTKFFCGPAWDYDSAWGYGGSRYDVDLFDPNTFYANLKLDEGTLWYGLYQQPVFQTAVLQIFADQVLPAMRYELFEGIDAAADLLADSAVMNNYRYNNRLGATLSETRENYYDRIESLKYFADKRTEFLEKEWLGTASSKTQ